MATLQLVLFDQLDHPNMYLGEITVELDGLRENQELTIPATKHRSEIKARVKQWWPAGQGNHFGSPVDLRRLFTVIERV